MGLHLTISAFHCDNHTGDYGPYEFDVVLTGLSTVEFPNHDIEEELVARELGFEIDSPELCFYDEYSYHGLQGLTQKIPDDIFSAFEEQGYHSIGIADFSRQTILDLLLESIEENEARAVEETLSILYPYVGKTEDGSSIDREDFIEALINGIKKIADPEINSEQYMGDLPLYLDALTSILDRSEFKVIESDPFYDEPECWLKTAAMTFEIVIHAELIIEWTESIDFIIEDPIHFSYRMSYPEEPESAPPVSVYDIVNYLGLKMTGLDAKAEPMQIPESVWFGPYAVRYTEYSTIVDRSAGRYTQKTDKSKIIGEEIVQYDTLHDAREAIALSDCIMRGNGSREHYAIALLERVIDEKGRPVEPDAFIVLEEDE